MTEELYYYLDKEFRFNNLKKYYDKYFKLWIDNLTEEQIIGFAKYLEDNKKYNGNIYAKN